MAGFLWIFGLKASSSPEGRSSTFNNRIEVQKFHLGGGNAIERIQLGGNGSRPVPDLVVDVRLRMIKGY